MKTDQDADLETVFPHLVNGAVSHLKNRLQREYEHAYPGLGDIIRIVLDEEEAKAWELSPFPHLFLPDLWKRTSRNSGCNLRSLDTTMS